MVVNCLPLYEPPPFEEEEAVDSTDSPPRSPEKPLASPSTKKVSLIKARSVEALDHVAAELELHDQDYEDIKSEGESFSRTVPQAPRKWSRMSASFSKNLRVMVRNIDDLPPPGAVPVNGLGSRSTSREECLESEAEVVGEECEAGRGAVSPDSDSSEKKRETSEERENVMKEESSQSKEDKPDDEEARDDCVVSNEEDRKLSVEGGAQGGGNAVDSLSSPSPDVSIEEFSDDSSSRSKPNHQSRRRLVKSCSPLSSEVENGSDGENERSLTVNYLDTTTMSTLKRSSGSVSFYYRATNPPSVAMETSIEESMENSLDDLDSTRTTVIVETKGYYSNSDASPSAPPSSSLTTPHGPVVSVLIPSILPTAPPTMDQEYLERSGWLNKLSHRKGVFGDKWQKRYFVLHRSWLYYFKKYGVRIPCTSE
jgi:hypothetical protein